MFHCQQFPSLVTFRMESSKPIYSDILCKALSHDVHQFPSGILSIELGIILTSQTCLFQLQPLSDFHLRNLRKP